MIITSLICRTFHIGSVLFLGFLICFTHLRAQIAKPGYEDKLLFRGISGITVGGTQMQWELKGYKTISQQSAPLTIAVPLSNRVLLTAANYGAISASDTTKVQGIADTRVSLSYVLPGDKFWLTAGASIPTGKTKLESDELTMMSIMSQNAFAYKVPVFGQGLNANLGGAYATPLTRRFVLGLGISYVYKGTYEPLAVGGTEYDPGDEISANVGFDYITYSKTSRVSFDLTASYFGEDELQAGTVFKFQSGARLMAFGVYALRTETVNHQLSGRLRYRLPNTTITDTASTKYDAGMQIEGQYSLTYPLNEWLTGVAVGELKYYTADQLPVADKVVETGKAQIISLGPDLLFHFTDTVLPILTVRYSTGGITIDDEEYDLTGFEIGLGLKVSF